MKLFNLSKEQTGGLYFSLLISLYCVVLFIGQSIIMACVTENTFGFYALSYALPLIALSLCVILHGKKNAPVFSKPIINKNLRITIPISLILAFGMFFGLGFVNGLVVNAFESLGLKVNSTNLIINGTLEYLFYILVVAILPALLEELFFRKLLIDNFLSLGKPLAIILSAFLFAIYHASVSQLIYQFIYGLLLGLLYVKSKSELPSIFAHFINNFAVLSFTYFNVNINLSSPLLISLGLVALVGGVVWLLLIDRKGEKLEPTGKKSQAVLYSGFGIFICLTLMIASLFM
ncbi:MAG: CPBP family intramembrane metalloprotease [Clostridia bacterium]|nr:CPBP family intramembrane metalloprotease [Clostridia bacterium]